MSKRFVSLLCCLAIAIVCPTAPASAARGDMMLIAKSWFYAFEQDRIDRRQLDPTVNGQLTEDLVRREGAKLRSYGPPTAWKYLQSEKVSYATGYDFLISFRHALVVESIAIDSDGRIGGIDFRSFVKE